MSTDDQTTPNPGAADDIAAAAPAAPPVPPLPAESANDAAAAAPAEAPPGGIAPPPVPVAAAPRPAWLAPQPLGLAALVGAIGMGAAVAAAILVAVLSLLFGVVSGTLDLNAGGIDLDAGSASPLSLIIWIATLGLFGTVSGGAAASVFGSSVTISFIGGLVPVIVFLAAVTTAAWWAYRQERAQRTQSRAGLWALAGVTGVAGALLSLLLAVIGRTSVSASGMGGVEVSTLSAASFFGPLVTLALASVFGRWLARAVPARVFGAALWQAPSRFAWGTRDLYDYAVVLLALFVPASLVTTFILGDGMGSAWPVAVGVLTAVVIALGHFGAISISASFPGLGSGGMSQSGWLLSPHMSPWAWVLVLLALVAAAAAAILIGARRASAPVPLSRAWRLPVLTAAATLVLGIAFGTAYVFGAVGAAAASMGFAASLTPAWWNVLIAGVWGAIVEALARFVAPLVLSRWPALARVSLGGAAAAGAAAATPAGSPAVTDARTEAPATVDGTAPQPVGAVPGAAPQPLSPAAKRNLLIGGIVTGAVVLLAIGGAVTVGILKSTVFSPERAAEAYVDDIAHGRFEAAFARTPGDTTGTTALVSSNAVKLDAAISGVTFGAQTTAGDVVTIPVSYEVDGERDSGVVTLTSAGTQFLFFDEWRVTGGLESRATIIGAPVTIGGVSVDPGSDGASLIAYPGVYPVTADVSKWETVEVEPLHVTSMGAQLSAQPEPSQALVDEVQRQVDAQLDACAKSTDLRPAGCPFSAYSWGDTKDIAWKITTYPTVEVRTTDSFSAYDGAATATFQRKDWNDEWVKEDYESSVSIYSGRIAIDGDTVTVTLG